MQTKKHFEKAAEIIRSEPLRSRKALFVAFSKFFHNENPRFDAERFAKACLSAYEEPKVAFTPENLRHDLFGKGKT